MSAMRRSTIGRSPEMPRLQNPGCPPPPRRMVSEEGRNVGSGVDQVSRETLEQRGFARIDAEVAELHLRLGPGSVAARSKAVVSRCLSMRSSSASREDATTVQKAMRTIAPGAIRTRRRRAKTGSSTVPTVFESGRPSITAIGVRTLQPRPRNRALSVSTSGLPTVSPSTTARCAAQISGSVGDAPPPRRQNGADVGQIFGLDEQLGKGRMRDVGGLGRQHELGIGRDLDLPHPAAGIRDRDAADLGIVFRRDEHLHVWSSAFRRGA